MYKDKICNIFITDVVILIVILEVTYKLYWQKDIQLMLVTHLGWRSRMISRDAKSRDCRVNDEDVWEHWIWEYLCLWDGGSVQK